MGAHTDRCIDLVDAIQSIHAEVPRPPFNDIYTFEVINNFVHWDAVEYGLEYQYIDEVISAEGLDDAWEEDWETDEYYRAFIRARLAKYHWSLVRKSVKAAPIVKYWFDVTMHTKYSPGGVGYYQAKADFHQESKNDRKRTLEDREK